MSKVLVVDDSFMVRTQVSRVLQEAGFTIVEARDGVEAMECVRVHADVRLAICDVNMPRMSGLEFLEELKKQASTIPVLMLTTEGQPAMMQQAKALGARGWVIKPFKTDILVATAKKLAA